MRRMVVLQPMGKAPGTWQIQGLIHIDPPPFSILTVLGPFDIDLDRSSERAVYYRRREPDAAA